MKGKVVPTEGPPSAAVSTADVVVPVANRSIPTPEHLEHHDYAKLNTAYENKQDSQVAPQAVEKEFVNETSGIDTSLGKFSDGKAIAAVESPLPGGSNGEDAKSTATSENGKIALSATTTAQQDRPSNAPAAAIVVAEENRDTPAIAPQDTTTVYSNDASTVAAQDPLAVTVQQDTPTVGQPEQESVFAEAAAADTNTSGQNNGGENQAIVSSNSSQQQQQEGRSARQTSSSTITTFDVESTENGHESDDEEVSIDERFKGGILSRRGTRRIRKDTAVGGVGKSKAGSSENTVRGHPVGSAAADFLERRAQREEVTTIRQEEVKGKLKLVMEHDPATSGSPLPDIDRVFPPQHASLDGDLLL